MTARTAVLLEITGDSKQNISQQCGLIAKKQITRRVTLISHQADWRKLLASWTCYYRWLSSNFKGDMEELEKVRHQWWPEYTLGENVVVSDLVGLLKRKWRNNLILACSYLTGGYKAERMLFVCVCVITEDTTDLIYNMRGSIWTFGKDVFTRRVRAQKHAIQEGVGIFNFEGFQDILTQKCGWPNAAWQPSCFKQEVEMDTSGGPSKHFHSFKIAVPSKPPHVS